MRVRIAPVGLLAVLAASVWVGVPRDARAAEFREWVGLGSGDRLWSGAVNWDGGQPIAEGDFLTFAGGSPGGRLTNDLPLMHFQRIEFGASTEGYVLEGNSVLLSELTAGANSGTNAIEFDIGFETQVLVAAGAKLILSGANNFLGDVDIFGELEARSNTALGNVAGDTTIQAGGQLTISGRDLGQELIRVAEHAPGDCAIVNETGASVVSNIQVGKFNCFNNGGTLNFPNGIAELAGEFDLLLFGGTYLVGGTSDANGPLRVTGQTNLVWNSTAPVAISFEPFEQFVPGGNLTGSGTAASLEFRRGTFSPGTGATSGRFTVTGALALEDVTFPVLLNGSTTGTGYSLAQAGGPIALGPGTQLNIVLGFNPTEGQSFRVIDNTGAGAVVGTFEGLAEGAQFDRAGRSWTITYKGGTGNDVEITAGGDADPLTFRLLLPMVAAGN